MRITGSNSNGGNGNNPLAYSPDLRGVPPNIVRELETLRQFVGSLQAQLQTSPAVPSYPPLSAATIDSIVKQTQAALQSNGTHPLNLNGLIGSTATPQTASIPSVLTLPGPQDPLSANGVVVYNSATSQLYRFDGSTIPGTWKLISGIIQLAQTLTAPVTIADPGSTIPVGAEVEYQFTQDATGWPVSWDPVFKGVDALTVGITPAGYNVVRFRKIGASFIPRLFSLSDIL